MPKDALQQDEEHQFTGVTVKIVSVSNIKTQIDGVQIYIRIKCHDKGAQTKKRKNDAESVSFNQDFFYNTTEILDDDICFELYQQGPGQGVSKNLVASSRVGQSKVSNSRMNNDTQGRYLGSTKVVQISRQKRQTQQKTYDIFVEQTGKTVGKITVVYDFLQRQDIVGGIKCPNLSLRPDKNVRSGLTLQNKYAAYKNLYSFLDGNQTPNCEFFPKKFKH